MARRFCALALLAGALLFAACGSEEDGEAPAPPQPAAAKPADFPAVAEGDSLSDLTRGMREGPILASAVSELEVGDNRFAFALFDRGRKQLDVPAVALYTANQDGSGAEGPFVARKESADVDTRYRSQLAAADLAQGDKFYVATLPFAKKGTKIVLGLVRFDGRLVVSQALMPAKIGTPGGPPLVGQKAIKVHTLTDVDVGRDLSKISTRIPPPPEMLTTDFADVVGKKPVVLVIATPKLCSSRTCGPVVDIAEQVRATTGKGVTFIQQEVYEDIDPNKPRRKQLFDWGLTTEPWTFVIGRDGRISSRLEGIYSVGELARAVAKVK